MLHLATLWLSCLLFSSPVSHHLFVYCFHSFCILSFMSPFHFFVHHSLSLCFYSPSSLPFSCSCSGVVVLVIFIFPL
ncbi:hypothetical protein V8C44DRAFT_318691 [Trichoderma aethiopicum]